MMFCAATKQLTLDHVPSDQPFLLTSHHPQFEPHGSSGQMKFASSRTNFSLAIMSSRVTELPR
jgi:hypothetical protein